MGLRSLTGKPTFYPKLKEMTEGEVIFEKGTLIKSEPGIKYLLYFIDGGSVGLDLSGYKQSYKLKWIDLKTGDWHEETTITGGEIVQVSAPDKGGWLATVVKF